MVTPKTECQVCKKKCDQEIAFFYVVRWLIAAIGLIAIASSFSTEPGTGIREFVSFLFGVFILLGLGVWDYSIRKRIGYLGVRY